MQDLHVCIYIIEKLSIKLKESKEEYIKCFGKERKKRKKMKENFVEMEKVELVLITYVA